MAILVAASQWLQQKMSMTPPTDPKQAQQAQMMLWMMPMMFGLLALSFPAGLSLYWVTSSVVRIVLQYRVTGWGGLRRQAKKPTESEKKYLKFDASVQKKSTDEIGADIVVADSDASKMDKNALKPGKMRYQPGKDRLKRHPKK